MSHVKSSVLVSDRDPIFLSDLLVHHNKLEELVGELSAQLNNIKREQEFMEIRERIHRSSSYHRIDGGKKIHACSVF